MNSDYVVDKLSHLIVERQIQQIHIYRFSDARLFAQSADWRFGHEFIHVGEQSYNLNRVITFRIIDRALQLYF